MREEKKINEVKIKWLNRNNQKNMVGLKCIDTWFGGEWRRMLFMFVQRRSIVDFQSSKFYYLFQCKFCYSGLVSSTYESSNIRNFTMGNKKRILFVCLGNIIKN